MSDDNYIHLLRCPIEHLPLSRASNELVRQVAESLQRIMNGDRQNTKSLSPNPTHPAPLPASRAKGASFGIGSKNWIPKMDGGLIRSDGRIMYPIIDGIPKLLVDEAIDLEQLGLAKRSEGCL